MDGRERAQQGWPENTWKREL